MKGVGASYYIDNRADERQFEALSNIITGRAGEPFAVYASIMEEIQEPKKASVKFQTKDIRSRVTVSGTSEDKNEESEKCSLKMSLLKHGLNRYEIL